MSLPFRARLQFLFGHPEFKRSPVLVSGRLLLWLGYRCLGIAPTISVHQRSAMKLHPAAKGMGAPGLFYVFRGAFEETVPYCVSRFVKAGSSCFDIGANVGIWTLLMAEQCGETGRVYSFEPLARNLAQLRKNIELSHHSNVTVVPTALGTQPGTVKIYTPADPGRSSLAPETPNDQIEEVPLKRLDEVWAELNRPKIAFVKMDVEGSEPFVLKGAPEFLRECRPIIQAEINSAKLANLGNAPADLFKIMRELDYDAFLYDEEQSQLVPTAGCQGGDVVFIPKGLPQISSAV
jgi:FkbM family methyltransferase